MRMKTTWMYTMRHLALSVRNASWRTMLQTRMIKLRWDLLGEEEPTMYAQPTLYRDFL